MQTELKSYCVNCGGPMAFPPELQGERIICPHCNVLTMLGTPVAKPPPFRPVPPEPRGHIKTKTESMGVGCLIQGVSLLIVIPGLFFTFTIPILGIPILAVGLVLAFVGSAAARKCICSNCGNPIASKSVKRCPSCQVQFK